MSWKSLSKETYLNILLILLADHNNLVPVIFYKLCRALCWDGFFIFIGHAYFWNTSGSGADS